MLSIQTKNDFALSLEDIKKLNDELSEFKSNIDSFSNDDILFFDANDIRKITGWSKHTIETLFNNPAFPSTDIGKKKLVLKTAFIKFFMERRCKDNQIYWK